jgi:hypothetical protein
MGVFIVDESDNSGCIDENSGRLCDKVLNCFFGRPFSAKVDSSGRILGMDSGELVPKIHPDIFVSRVIGGN